MIFNNFFLDYKISLKNLKNYMKFKELATYRKIYIILFPLLLFLFLVCTFLKKTKPSLILISLMFICTILLIIFDYKKENSKMMLNKHYLPNSKKRMNVVLKLLDKYNINVDDIDTIDRIIKEAKIHQKDFDYVSIIKKHAKSLSAAIGFLLTPAIDYIVETHTEIDNLNIYILASLAISMVYLILLFLEIIFKGLFYYEYKKYDELINDLRQIKIFYSNNKKNRQKLKKDIRKIKNTMSLKKVHEIKIIISQ